MNDTQCIFVSFVLWAKTFMQLHSLFLTLVHYNISSINPPLVGGEMYLLREFGSFGLHKNQKVAVSDIYLFVFRSPQRFDDSTKQ